MSSLADSRYLKMNGLGNEILVVDLRGSAASIDPDEVRRIASRTQTRFDQMMVIRDPVSAGVDATLEILNTDGSYAQACGNGTRCVAWAMMDDPVMRRPHGPDLVLESAGGRLIATRDAERTFTVDMGEPKLDWQDIPLAERFNDTRRIELQIGPIDAPILHSPSAVSMGNPHVVFWVADPAAYDLARIGPMLEHHPLFPERANISLAQVAARDRIVLRVWERGAGLTRACGSAACAALVAAYRKGLTARRATVTLPGGDLVIEWRQADGHVLMTGPVELEHEGILHLGAAIGAAAGAA